MPHTPGPYTPGPWKADGEFVGTDEEDHQTIAYCSGHRNRRNRPRDVTLSNARLIAAAPELLEAMDPDSLDAIADEIDCFEHSARAASLRVIAEKQRSAIAKSISRNPSI